MIERSNTFIDIDKVVEEMMTIRKESAGHEFNMRVDDYKYYAFSIKYANGAYYSISMPADNIFEWHIYICFVCSVQKFKAVYKLSREEK